MNTLSRKSGSPMRRLGALVAIMGAFLFALPLSLQAQETTGSLRGTISAPGGSAIANASVRITDTRTGNGRTITTNQQGSFTADGLRVGGPYTVAVNSSSYSSQTVNDIYVDLGDTYFLPLTLRAAAMEELVVTATAIKTVQTAVGPSATFGLADLQDAPAINRDIKDLIRIDPRVYIDEAFNDAIQCAGANQRFNSLTVDGVKLNDNFGLNSNGYPTTRIPFSYDAIEQVAVELAPFDVQYGGFTACNINAVTKSGTNEFTGAVFYDFTDESLTGGSLEDTIIDLGVFEEKRYGVSIGGPIIPDRLFFFASYEELEGVELFDRAPAGTGAGREVLGVSQADFARIDSILRNVYNYDPGGLPATLPVEDEKITLKVDLNINDNHRAALTYNYNDGFSISQSDGDDDELEFSNHYYERGAELNSYSGQLFSNWTDAFSTELRVAYAEIDARVEPLGGTDFGEFQITTFNNGSRATVYAGADDSRHANKLDYDSTSFKLAANYNTGIHIFSGGFERDTFSAFNKFIQEAEGEYRFDSIDDLENGTPNRVTYENARITNNSDDAAATFEYDINIAYFQDTISWDDYGISMVLGLRYEWYTSDDVPPNNPNFVARNGFSNAQNFDGEGVLQPRFGLTWDVNDRLSLRGGVGVYSGGNPNVWLSNGYSNNGITQVEVQDRSLDDGLGDTLFTIPFNGGGQPGFDIPQDLFDQVAAGQVNGGVNALDPNFEIPTELKIAIGATFGFDAGFLGEGYTVNADYLYSSQKNGAIVTDSTLAQVGTAPDGRPLYTSVDNSDPDCVDPTSPDCSSRLFASDFILTNIQGGSEGTQTAYSLALTKSYDFGLDWTLAYAYVESSDVNPMTSSVAFSNYANTAVSDPNNPGRARSNYQIPNRITLKASYKKAFFGDNQTKITLFGSANEGRPFSYAFTDGCPFCPFGDTARNRQLLYVPTGPSDPLVAFDPGFDQAAFFDFVNSSGLSDYSGQIAPRNAFKSGWWTKFDLKVEQELPGFGDDHRFSGFFVIENLGNLLNDEWGVLKEVGFPRVQDIVNLGGISGGQFEFDDFFVPGGERRVTDASLWEVRFGIRYSF